ncbi:DnaA regulatory inactivator HdaA [Rhizobium paknamense]|uniref:Chromosomal replication initiation ATPase DnaA n=1 Tax=Rhizobium paknamense TaxID=1206817 RepID=A0ABU0I7A4_9HYPH|nr:DnaA regulatory inactivator HdaA [Rhizobium paknamense]MDQ0454109.1 chromosomal replication initiation ATPase DnaA [Rhizobium paknamense]
MRDINKGAARRTSGEQLPLAFAHQPASGREDLLVSERLAAAVAIIDSWPEWPSPVVILTGPQGSGKSHLAEVWRSESGASDILPLSGSNASVKAGEGPVLFEDADRAGFDEVELFHVINSVRQHGTSLLMTSRSWPLSWNVALPDLRSRLKAATLVEIGEPDEALLSQVIFKLFSDRQLSVDDRIIATIVSRMERSLAAAQEVVERIDRLALARRARITRALALEVLAEMNPVDDSRGE